MWWRRWHPRDRLGGQSMMYVVVREGIIVHRTVAVRALVVRAHVSPVVVGISAIGRHGRVLPHAGRPMRGIVHLVKIIPRRSARFNDLQHQNGRGLGVLSGINEWFVRGSPPVVLAVVKALWSNSPLLPRSQQRHGCLVTMNSRRPGKHCLRKGTVGARVEEAGVAQVVRQRSPSRNRCRSECRQVCRL